MASLRFPFRHSPLSTLQYSRRAQDWRWLFWALLKVHQRPPDGTSWRRRSSPWSHCTVIQAATWWLCCWNNFSICPSPSCCKWLVALIEGGARSFESITSHVVGSLTSYVGRRKVNFLLTFFHTAHVAQFGSLVLAIFAGTCANLQTILLTNGARADLVR